MRWNLWRKPKQVTRKRASFSRSMKLNTAGALIYKSHKHALVMEEEDVLAVEREFEQWKLIRDSNQ
jgi:hypothetical protein